ncbi:MAG: hypothetical protein WDM81_12940 [Rhizomicrobium sp.]
MSSGISDREVPLLPLSEDGVRVTSLPDAFETWGLGAHTHVAEPMLAD